MRLRLFIISLLLLAYGSILGHEVVFGHHLSPETECHKHDARDAEHHKEDCRHTPCIMNLNPHFATNLQDQITFLQEIESIFPDLLMDYGFTGFENTRVAKPLIFHRNQFKLPNSPNIRSHGLRGPPLA